MEISKKIMNDLRLRFLRKLCWSNQPRSGKLKIPKETLEELLFDTVTIKDKSKYGETYVIKLPVFSGDFLEAIDLSEVDFSNVSWMLLDLEYYENYFENIFSNSNLKKLYSQMFKKIRDSFLNFRKEIRKICASENFTPYNISFYKTNAKIDLTESFEAKNLGFIGLSSCNFNGFKFVDYSQFSVPAAINYYTVISSDLSGSNIVFDKKLYACESILDGIDLSSKQIDANYYLKVHKKVTSDLTMCSLRNTGVRISLNPVEFKFHKNDAEFGELNRKLIFVIENDYWAGCFINGKLFDSKDERSKRKMRIKSEIDSLSAAKFADWIQCFDKEN